MGGQCPPIGQGEHTFFYKGPDRKCASQLLNSAGEQESRHRQYIYKKQGDLGRPSPSGSPGNGKGHF